MKIGIDCRMLGDKFTGIGVYLENLVKKLNEIGYCNNLVVITSKIMEKNLSNLEVEYLAQKLQGKKVVNYNKNEKVHFIPKN